MLVWTGRVHLADLTGAKHPVFEMSGDLAPEAPVWIRRCYCFHLYFSGWSPTGLNSKWYWPCRTSKTEDLLVLQNLYWSYNFFFNIKRKSLCIKITDSIYFYLFYLHLFQKHLGYSWGETCLSECPQMFTGPVGPVQVFFTGLKLFLGIFTGLGP